MRAIPDRLGAKLAGARVELHARQARLLLGRRALDDQRSRVEEQAQRRGLAVGRAAGRAHGRHSREEIKLGRCRELHVTAFEGGFGSPSRIPRFRERNNHLSSVL